LGRNPVQRLEDERQRAEGPQVALAATGGTKGMSDSRQQWVEVLKCQRLAQ